LQVKFSEGKPEKSRSVAGKRLSGQKSESQSRDCTSGNSITFDAASPLLQEAETVADPVPAYIAQNAASANADLGIPTVVPDGMENSIRRRSTTREISLQLTFNKGLLWQTLSMSQELFWSFFKTSR
jgi:hypothetical protein